MRIVTCQIHGLLFYQELITIMKHRHTSLCNSHSVAQFNKSKLTEPRLQRSRFTLAKILLERFSFLAKKHDHKA